MNRALQWFRDFGLEQRTPETLRNVLSPEFIAEARKVSAGSADTQHISACILKLKEQLK